MKKEEYLTIISEKLGYQKKMVDEVISSYLSILSDKLTEKSQVTITNIGKFTKTFIEPKYSFSPIDGKTLDNKGYYRISFTISKTLQEKLTNNKK